ncbi:Tannase/feruloyl esterase [Ilyonectria destructans]|nr:Tannase/feruloyl esterase [Ilyonectria destructans]
MLVTAFLSLNLAVVSAAVHQRTLEQDCHQLPAPTVPGAQVISIKSKARYNVTINPLVATYYPALANITVDICDATVTLTHPGVDDEVGVTVWLPLKGWNGRFQGAGGGGWTAGTFPDYGLFLPVAQGWAAGFTDGGNIAINGTVGPQALSGPGQVDLGLLTDFASRGLHEIAVVGKAVVASFYNQPPKFSYWNGCSTGGRQGYMLAQKYAADFDGILANAPALSWPSFVLTLNWAHFLMNAAKVYPSHCEFAAFQKASIEACDDLDGVHDGIISDLDNCKFNPLKLVGKTIQCDGKPVKIGLGAALLVQRIREGPRSLDGQQLWEGYDFGIDYVGIAQTQSLDGKGIPGNQPYSLPDDWVKWFLKKDPNFDFTRIKTLQQLTDLYAFASAEYSGIIGTDNPDLSAFREAGGKMLTFHGLADQLIMANNTIRYRKAVESTLGGKAQVDQFYRLFLAPGVAHCAGGYGPVPVDPMASLVDWVENGKAPDLLPASFKNKAGQVVTKNLCLWPLVARYKGKGDPNRAESYTCATSYR